MGSMYEKQLMVRLDASQYAKLVAVARAKDRPVAWVVRSLIDRMDANA